MIYAGVGSRDTPESVLRTLRGVAKRLAELGWTLSTGAARGADTAFETGAASVGGAREIYLPWAGYEDRYPNRPATQSILKITAIDSLDSARAHQIAAGEHPVWFKLGQGKQKMHARNVAITLGPNFDQPRGLVICWTPDSVEERDECSPNTGGTGMAIRIARAHGVPVINFGRPDAMKRLAAFVETWRQTNTQTHQEQDTEGSANAETATSAASRPVDA